MEPTSDVGGGNRVPKMEMPEVDNEVAPSCEEIRSESFPEVQKCVFCCGNLTLSGSKLLECLHAVCSGCLAQWNEESVSEGCERSKECPECRLPSRRCKLVENMFFAETESVSEESNVHLCCCDNRRAVTDWCETCKDYICHECTIAHKQLACTKGHIIRPKEEGGMRSNSYRCPNHAKEYLELYCTSCEVMTCRDCQLLHHRDHKYKFIEELAKDTKNEMRDLVNNVLYKVNIVNSGIGVLDEKTKKIMDKKIEIIKEIKDYVRKMSELVTRTGKELLNAVNETCASKLESHEAHRQELVLVSKQATHCTDFVSKALAKSSNNCLLYSKQQILGHLKLMKSKKSQIPNPDFPIAIQLVKCQLDILEMLLQSFMTLQVDNQLLPANNRHKQVQTLFQFISQKILQIQTPARTASQPPPPPQQPPQQPKHYQCFTAKQQQQQQPAKVVQQQQQQQQQQVRARPPHPSGLSPSIQGLQKLQYQQTRHPQQFHPQGNPLRQQQVTSSTHPQQQAIMLQQQQQQQAAASHYMRTGEQPYAVYPSVSGYHKVGEQEMRNKQMQQYQLQQQQQQAAAVAHYQHYQRPPVPAARQPQQLSPMMHQLPSSPHASVSWHIPQTEPAPSSLSTTPLPAAQQQHLRPHTDSSYKIVLKSLTPSPSVTSSVPMTPSPIAPPPPNTPDDMEAALNDALVSFGDFEKTGESPGATARTPTEVDSSTTTPPAKDDATAHGQGENDDPNDDWCAVCMDGGDLVCCDKCPRVFHVNCHIPLINALPEEWQCLLCQRVTQITEVTSRRKNKKGLSEEEQRVVERILLELYCQYDVSLHFRAPVPPQNVEYFSKVNNPMSFDEIRARLDRVAVPSVRYLTVHQAIRDIRQVFRNAFHYYEVGTKEYRDGMQLEEFLELLLSTYLPQFAHTDIDQDTDSSEDDIAPVRKIRRVID